MNFNVLKEILENYYRSPFLGTDADDFPDSPRNECQGEIPLNCYLMDGMVLGSYVLRCNRRK